MKHNYKNVKGSKSKSTLTTVFIYLFELCFFCVFLLFLKFYILIYGKTANKKNNTVIVFVGKQADRNLLFSIQKKYIPKVITYVVTP